MMNLAELRELQQLAMKTAMKSGDIGDIEKAASVSKQLADVEKASSEGANQPKSFRYEEFKSWAALTVPFLSIATLAVTMYTQGAQLEATQNANQESQWRECVKSVLSEMGGPTGSVPDPALAMALLEPYTSNSRFGRDAMLLSVEILSRIPSSNRFRDYFFSHHLGESQSDVDFLTNLNRELFNNLKEVDQRLEADPALKAPSAPEKRALFDAAHDALAGNIEFVTGKLCALYKTRPTSAASTDFRDVFLMNGDISGLNLTGADLTGAKLQTVNLSTTTLAGDIKFKDAGFVDSNWWDAREISKPLLEFLMDTNYPYFDNENVKYVAPPPDKQKYMERIRYLCQKAGMAYPSSARYGEPPTPKQAEPTGGQPSQPSSQRHKRRTADSAK